MKEIPGWRVTVCPTTLCISVSPTWDPLRGVRRPPSNTMRQNSIIVYANVQVYHCSFLDITHSVRTSGLSVHLSVISLTIQHFVLRVSTHSSRWSSGQQIQLRHWFGSAIYTKPQASRPQHMKSSLVESVSFANVLHAWLRPRYKSSSNHRPNIPLYNNHNYLNMTKGLGSWLPTRWFDSNSRLSISQFDIALRTVNVISSGLHKNKPSEYTKLACFAHSDVWLIVITKYSSDLRIK